MLAKTLLNLDQIGRSLVPDFNPNEVIRQEANQLIGQQIRSNLSRSKLLTSLLDVQEFTETLPRRLNVILDRLSKNEMLFKVDAFDQQKLMMAFQKIANRITAGIVLAAMLLGAARLAEVPSSFSILGYPVLAILLFLGSLSGAVILLVRIFFQDETPHK